MSGVSFFNNNYFYQLVRKIGIDPDSVVEKVFDSYASAKHALQDVSLVNPQWEYYISKTPENLWQLVCKKGFNPSEQIEGSYLTREDAEKALETCKKLVENDQWTRYQIREISKLKN